MPCSLPFSNPIDLHLQFQSPPNFVNFYKNAPANPATATITPPAPAAKFTAAFVCVAVAEVELAREVRATLTPPLLVGALPDSEAVVVAAESAEETGLEIAEVVVVAYIEASLQ